MKPTLQLDVTVQVNDTERWHRIPNDTAALSITVTDVNEAPKVALSNTMVSTLSEACRHDDPHEGGRYNGNR